MMTLTVTFDTQSVSREDFAKIAQDGTLATTAGLLNLRWEEFSALDRAREFGLQDVIWEAVRDNSPGSLTCIFHYDTLTLPELQKRLLNPLVVEYELSMTDGNRRPPNNGHGSLHGRNRL